MAGLGRGAISICNDICCTLSLCANCYDFICQTAPQAYTKSFCITVADCQIP